MSKPGSISEKQSFPSVSKVNIELGMFKLLIESIQDYAIFLMDKDGYVLTWNKGAERNKGWKESEIVGRHFSAFYSEEDKVAQKPERELRIAAKIGRIEDEDWRIRKDGTRFWANVVITALRNESGELVGFAKVTRNLTERKRQEDELRQANKLLRQQQEELKQLNAAKDEFVSLASHQLRTPATAVKLILGALSEELYGEIDPAVLIHIRKAYESNERQIKIVNRILRAAQADSGKVVLRKALIDVQRLLKSIIDEQRESIGARNQYVTFVSGDVPIMMDVDSEHMGMALGNLVENAMKYSPDGGRILVTVQCRDHQVRISVRDDGIGIAPEDVKRLFGKFHRVRNRQTADIPGTGLGLFWTQKVVELHGGWVEVESELGRGSTFTVIIPREVTGA